MAEKKSTRCHAMQNKLKQEIRKPKHCEHRKCECIFFDGFNVKCKGYWTHLRRTRNINNFRYFLRALLMFPHIKCVMKCLAWSGSRLWTSSLIRCVSTFTLMWMLLTCMVERIGNRNNNNEKKRNKSNDETLVPITACVCVCVNVLRADSCNISRTLRSIQLCFVWKWLAIKSN